jgi:hypothetical protein
MRGVSSYLFYLFGVIGTETCEKEHTHTRTHISMHNQNNSVQNLYEEQKIHGKYSIEIFLKSKITTFETFLKKNI